MNLGLFPPAAGSTMGTTELSKHVLQLLYNADQPGGVPELLSRIRFIAATVRDRFSGDMWRILGRLELDGRTRPGRLPLTGATTLIHKLVLDLAAFGGMEMENMTRGQGWRFLDFGRRLERALCLVKLLNAAARIEPQPTELLEAVLEIADSVMTYRRRYFSAPRWPGLLELLLRDETNPRSFTFQLEALREHELALTVEMPAVAEVPNRVVALAKALRSARFDEIAPQPPQQATDALLHLLGDLVASMASLSDDITSRYFSHTTPRVS
jgi:uncharacterized alpha-E superfamily protein